jgi:hypothetical protein
MNERFELAFEGGVPFRYRRFHFTFAAAESTAFAVLYKLTMSEAKRPNDTRYSRDAHPAVIYGPSCGRHGTTIR